nr:hypothetical protein Q903MT_gene434 [Picea sitchensis]
MSKDWPLRILNPLSLATECLNECMPYLISFIRERVRLSGRFSPYINSHVPPLSFLWKDGWNACWLTALHPS